MKSKIAFYVSSLKELYENFIKENEDCLWGDEQELKDFIKKPEKINDYIENNLRNNEQLRYRAIAFFTRMDDLHDIAFISAKELLRNTNKFRKDEERYLDQLEKFSLAAKKDFLSQSEKFTKEFNYNFIELSRNNFDDLPTYLSKGFKIEFFHSERQKEVMSKYIQQFGSSMNGLGFILSRSNANQLYREAKII